MTPDMRDAEGPLAAHFDAARAARPEPGKCLIAAVVADAARAAEARAAPTGRSAGWGAVAALAASLALGFWIGASGIAPLPQAAGVEATGVEAFDPDAAAFFDLAFWES